MPNLSSTEVHESTTIPGARFVIKRITESMRANFREKLSPLNDQAQSAAREADVLESKPKESLTPEDNAKLIKLYSDITRIGSELVDPAWFEFGLVAIEDLTVDKVPITPSNLRELAPRAFYAEIVNTIRKRSELGGVEQKNSESATTSSGPVD